MGYDFFIFFLNFYSFFFKEIVFSENFFIQVLFLILSFFIVNNNNIYYMLLYVFFFFFAVGVFLSFWQLEFFTGFLWLIELTIIFVFLLILFFLNFKGTLNSYYTEMNFFKKMIMLFFLFFFNIFNYYESEIFYKINFNFFLFWDDYYECLLNSSMNDFSALLISYYYFNSISLILIGIILFFGSIVCIQLFQINKNDQNNNINEFINIFDFFLNSLTFIFIRKQNLINQNLTPSSIRFIKKKFNQ